VKGQNSPAVLSWVFSRLCVSPVLLEDSLQGRANDITRAKYHNSNKQCGSNWFSQARDRGAEFESKFMGNKMSDYDF
jgi:hypothetical protein